MDNEDELGFLREAIRLSEEKMSEGAGGPFGAVVVQNQQVIGRGWNCVTSLNDPTAHAEVMAIRDACSRLGSFSLAGCRIFSSCEPCPLCLAAIYWARLDELVFAASGSDAAAAGFDDQFIYQELSKPWQQRAVPVRQALRDEPLRTFRQWLNKSDRITY
ncbi:MAG TPA: nucleoside deaminase [Pirellulaceae bacterium]|nr:nucleoside deaminase [Pirellulaceae bacterium]